MDTHLLIYIAFYLVYRITENLAMARAGTLTKKPKKEWTMLLIILPYYLVAVGPLVEYLFFHTHPNNLTRILGGTCFLAATFFRVKAHLDLQQGFSMAIEHDEEHLLVTTGLYAYIRHPLYLGNLLLFVACPLFLAARVSWLFAVVGIVGILIRIKIEEKFLRENLAGYDAYMKVTHALIPKVF
ncbi:MAG: isoprenylcysteine carboxylmethyltransferase family protein [Anaerolineae bacterium]|nr:isoprenylcysteine carboxylmethyltransferase family protein [Anaerolineae bacterium]